MQREQVMKKISVTLALLILIPAILTGCSSFRTGKIPAAGLYNQTRPEKIHINAEIWGVYLFQKIPIWSGSYVKAGRTTMFKTTTKIDTVMKLLEKESRKLGPGKIINVSSYCTSEWVPLSGIFWYREVQISATFVRGQK